MCPLKWSQWIDFADPCQAESNEKPDVVVVKVEDMIPTVSNVRDRFPLGLFS